MWGGGVFPALIPELKMEIEHKMCMNPVKICNTTNSPLCTPYGWGPNAAAG